MRIVAREGRRRQKIIFRRAVDAWQIAAEGNGGGFRSAPSMGADFAVKVRYTLGSEEC